MKNIVFITTHLGSGTESLLSSMDHNPRIQVHRGNSLRYANIESIEKLTSVRHKLGNSAAIYADRLVYNHEFSCKAFYSFCKFIYLIRDARPTLNSILYNSLKKKSAIYVERYYRYRLRRIYEMAKQTPGAILVTWEDVLSINGLKLIEEYLNLKEPLHLEVTETTKEVIDVEIAKRAQECYERYLFKLRNLDLRYIK